jgi:integrase
MCGCPEDRIENDVKHGYYDASLLKYRPLTIGKNASEITTVELFDRFTQHQFKHEGLAKSSIKSRYKPVKRMLEKHLNVQAAAVDKRRAVSFADVCGDTLTPRTAKARIMLLTSAWECGRGRYQLAEENPWVGIATRFKSIPVQPVAAFTKDEAKKIIEGFRSSRYYSHYADFVAFRLGMDTKGGEASALNQHLAKLPPDTSAIDELVKAQIEPLADLLTELETYTQNQFKAVREELKKPLAIAR